jgi:hypothetical protein
MAQIIIFTGTSALVSTRAIGAYQIANVLRDNGYTVQVIDYFPFMMHKRGINFIKQVLEKFVDDKTIWIGLSTTFFHPDMLNQKPKEINFNYAPAFLDNSILISDQEKFEIKEFVKKINPNTKWVVGGSRAWMYEDWHPLVDCYIEGYADSTVLEYTKFLEGKNPFLSYRKNSNGSISIIHDRKGSHFNFTDYKFSWHESDHINPNESLPIELSRGCIFKCKFCAFPLNGKNKFDYIKNLDILYNEFLSNYEKFGTTNYVFLDDTYNDSPFKVELLYEKVFSRLPFKINWGAYLRLDLLAAHPHTIDILKASGIRVAFFGIESLNYESNKVVGKGLRPEKIQETLSLIKERWPNVTLQGGFIIGLPNDSEKTIREWLHTLSSPNYPLDKVTLSVLQLWPKVKKEQDVVWMSEFEKDPVGHGYTFNYDNQAIWENNVGLNKVQARLMCNEFEEILQKNNKDSWGWAMSFGLLNSAYKDLDEVQLHQESELKSNADFFNLHANLLLNKYLDKLLT